MERELTTEEVMALLVEQPGQVATVTAGLMPAQLRTPLAPDEWSAVDILAHLRACADVWGDCIATILAEDTPTIRAINPRHWIKRTNYRDLEFEESFNAFRAQRSELLARLETLPSDSWSRRAHVVGAGRNLERTVFFYARWLATHERSHVKHIARLVRGMT